MQNQQTPNLGGIQANLQDVEQNLMQFVQQTPSKRARLRALAQITKVQTLGARIRKTFNLHEVEIQQPKKARKQEQFQQAQPGQGQQNWQQGQAYQQNEPALRLQPRNQSFSNRGQAQQQQERYQAADMQGANQS